MAITYSTDPDYPNVIVALVSDGVHRVTENGRTVGYQWGGHGKVYRSKAKAQAQARAIYASGFRGDAAPARAARRKVAQALKPNWHAERRYRIAVAGILAGVHRGIEKMVEREVLPPKVARQDLHGPHVDRHREPIRENDSFRQPMTRDADDSIPDRARRVLTPRLREKVAKHVRAGAQQAYDVMAGTVDKKNRAAMGLIGIPLKDAAAGVAGKVATMRENNVRLISDAGRDYVDDVLDVFTDPQNEGLRIEALRDKLFERGSVSLSRARFLATDQTLKLSGALTQARQQAAGVDKYRWSSSLDERVRPMHADLEGQEIDWDDPPITNPNGDTNHPGFDYNCRCVAIPVVQDLDELEDDDEIGPTFGGGGALLLGAAVGAFTRSGTGLGVITPRSKDTPSPDDGDDDEESLQPIRATGRGVAPSSTVGARRAPGAKRRR